MGECPKKNNVRRRCDDGGTYVFTAAPKVDDLPIPMNPYDYVNPRKLKEDVQRLREVDRQNKALLKKINMINRKGGWTDTYNPNAYNRTGKWKSHEQDMKRIVKYNKAIYKMIISAVSHYNAKMMEEIWKGQLKKIEHSAKLPFIILEKLNVDQMLRAQPSISEGLEKGNVERPLMLYLEDYLEMIEHLPQELRDRFTDMREMDLSIHNNMDELEKRVKIFFNECKKYPTDNLPQNIDAEYQAIRKEYYKALEDADEKSPLSKSDHIGLQAEICKMRHLISVPRGVEWIKLLLGDRGTYCAAYSFSTIKVKVPLKRILFEYLHEMEEYDILAEGVNSSSFRYSRPRGEKRRDSSASQLPSQYSEKRQAVAAVAPPPLVETRHTTMTQAAPPVTSTISYNLGHTLGAGPAIAAAASQAIAATQQMQQGRRTASLKASYEAINTGGHGHEFSIGRELAGAAQTAIQAIQQDHANNKNKKKKDFMDITVILNDNCMLGNGAVVPRWFLNVYLGPASDCVFCYSYVSARVTLNQVASQNAEVTDGEWTYDPNEPRYCLCNQVSYGDMVACDNADCPSEWFHYPCVGITAPPKGKWYCPQCTASMKRRGSRKN
ncbi:hypothetical protein NQ317_012631 [Molorchus minor]|uniref:Inhibitor of growth protein n=1 Tax=Molorchus minor TaxID=1323400 RepID=A0ABQ9J4H7_9CUCU|nr:hypothetical protein NQ317_012631 [Molorchus minor]